jgi:hypothetical protein
MLTKLAATEVKRSNTDPFDRARELSEQALELTQKVTKTLESVIAELEHVQHEISVAPRDVAEERIVLDESDPVFRESSGPLPRGGPKYRSACASRPT